MSAARALFRVDFAVCQRSRGGNALKLAAYNACTRTRFGGKTYDFRRKAAEHVGKTVFMTPDGFPAHRFPTLGALWRAAESAEKRCDGQTARQVLLTIPREVPEHLRERLVRHVVKPWIDDGMAAQADLHDPGARDGDAQPHAHILLTMREFDASGFAPTKARGRDWNRAFTADRYRTMRAQVAARMNEFFESKGLAIRVDHRTNLEIDGPDALPPEPTISRAAVEAAKRNPGNLPPAVVALDRHRATVKAIRELDRRIGLGEQRADKLRRRVSAAQKSLGRTTMTTQTNIPWVKAEGPLTPAQRASAERSYARWREAQLRRGKQAESIFGFSEYVGFVQDKKQFEGPRPSQNRNAAFARQTRRAPDDEAGFSKRNRFLADLLAEHYDVGKLDPSVAAQIRRIKLDKEARTATVFLKDGTSFTDYGDRIEFHGNISQPSATEIAAAAGRHGWTKVQLTGSSDFRDETAIALALHEPPIEHDHVLSPAAAARLKSALAVRRMRGGIAPAATTPNQESNDVPNAIIPALVAPAAAPGGVVDAAAANPDSSAAWAAGGPILGASDGGCAGAGGGGDAGDGDGGGVAAVTDEQAVKFVAGWLATQLPAAQAIVARRPTHLPGNGRAANRRADEILAFDRADTTVRAHMIIECDAVLGRPAQYAAEKEFPRILANAFRAAGGNPGVAVRDAYDEYIEFVERAHDAGLDEPDDDPDADAAAYERMHRDDDAETPEHPFFDDPDAAAAECERLSSFRPR